MDIDVEAAPLETLPADLLQAQIPPGSRLHGVEISELRLPAEANVALIVRGRHGFVPDPATTLRAGDRLLVVAAAGVRDIVYAVGIAPAEAGCDPAAANLLHSSPRAIHASLIDIEKPQNSRRCRSPANQ
jgi:hypothetical protein